MPARRYSDIAAALVIVQVIRNIRDSAPLITPYVRLFLFSVTIRNAIFFSFLSTYSGYENEAFEKYAEQNEIFVSI